MIKRIYDCSLAVQFSSIYASRGWSEAYLWL